MAKMRLPAIKGYFWGFVLLTLLLSGGMAGFCADGYELVVGLDKQEYNQGEMITVTAEVYGDQVNDIYIGFTLEKDNQPVAVWQDKTGLSGEASWNFDSDPFDPGTYSITAAAGAISAGPVQFIIVSAPPVIESTSPDNGDKNASVSKSITVVFSKNIEPGSAYGDITLKNDNDKNIGFSKEIIGTKLVINPNKNLATGTEYTVYIPVDAVKGLQEEYSFSFTTAKSTGGGGGGSITIPGTVPSNNSGCVFADLPDSHWSAAVVKALCRDGIIRGYPGGMFRPDYKVTRAEFAKMIVMSKGLSEVKPAMPTFKDVKSSDWYYGYVEAAAQAGLVEGLDTGEFQPDRNITREQIAAILVRALGKGTAVPAGSGQAATFSDEKAISGWAADYVRAAVNEGLVNGYPDQTFKPVHDTTRAEACTMLSRLLAKI
ncbi:MAG: Endoglucanase precursor [Pelotomaculum sp. PtaB.Bin104]|nr:MAG: Endoglucanase precursor [Pelotomaculum sp. PtaB.Bin104]